MDAGRRSAYLRDFETQIRVVDTYISAKVGNAPTLIFTYEERPNQPGGYHVEDLASYYPQLTAAFPDTAKGSKAARKPMLHFYAYLIYAPAVIRFVERALERSTLSGYGDMAIHEFWVMLAVTLTRFRVLAHKELFRGIKLRTKEDMIKYRLLFTASNNEIEGLRNIESQNVRLTLNKKSDVYTVDTFWTLQLVAHALESGRTFEEALEYITRS
jgi:hypothetical protein